MTKLIMILQQFIRIQRQPKLHLSLLELVEEG